MTFANLRALHALIGSAIDDIEKVYNDNSAKFTPVVPSSSPPFQQKRMRSRAYTLPASTNTTPVFLPDPPLDFPDLDSPAPPPPPSSSTPEFTPVASSESKEEERRKKSEKLSTHPEVVAAASKIVAACGQISAMVQKPFLTLCDAAMGYHLPACLRFLEEAHIVEMLRSAGSKGMHVKDIVERLDELYKDTTHSHILRLLATHHITREVRPDVFANNRVSSWLDSGKQPKDLVLRSPQTKYEGTNGVAAFIGLCTDELFKASAYLTDCYLPRPVTTSTVITVKHPMHAPFNVAFGTSKPYFEWLEEKGNEGRLKRFGKAMTGTGEWEVNNAVIDGFPWTDLPDGSVVVDVGGGIGSTSMLLANAFNHLKFVIQDRPQVVEMGLAAWKTRCPEMLEQGIAHFQAHDFFSPQPEQIQSKKPRPIVPAVYLLRVITHDWPNAFVTRILLHLRQSALPDTKLLLADYILPHACVDEGEKQEDLKDEIFLPGRVRTLAPDGTPLLPNLGKANANAYWLDLTMRVVFNAQERTLRELSALTLTAGWKVVQVTRTEGSLFGHVIAVPVEIPQENLKLLEMGSIPGEVVPQEIQGTLFEVLLRFFSFFLAVNACSLFIV
ncbi:S-adenosyl-L-methionine-dependent methyltransferase [Abortiporus biennis]|nr:S-adenosyl-L-methionine-dependent methyltransferase [Abortiporus biennis]